MILALKFRSWELKGLYFKFHKIEDNFGIISTAHHAYRNKFMQILTFEIRIGQQIEYSNNLFSNRKLMGHTLPGST